MDKHATSTGNPRRGQNGRHRGAERVHRSVQLALDAAAQSRQEGGGVATLFVRYSEMRQNPQSVGRSNGETFSARFRTYEKMQSPQNVGKSAPREIFTFQKLFRIPVVCQPSSRMSKRGRGPVQPCCLDGRRAQFG